MIPQYLANSYGQLYLNQYWPEIPSDPTAWGDNCILMLAYQEAAIAALHHRNGMRGKMLDVSTGPALAPLMAMMNCVSEVQLSDYNADNRNALQRLPIEYWRNYVPTLIKIFDRPEQKTDLILNKLNELRLKHAPVEVDLFREEPFSNAIKPHDFDFISMQFVADGITDNLRDYNRILSKVTDMVRPGGAFIMSAVVDADWWKIGELKLPAPSVSEKSILDILTSLNLKVTYLSRSMRHCGLTYSGGWIVLTAVRD